MDETNQAQSPSLGEQFSNFKFLLTNTFTIVGRDSDILTPLIRNIVYSIIQLLTFFTSVYLYAIGSALYGSVALLLWLCLFTYFVFYLNYQEMRLSWLVSETLKGNDQSFSDACDRTNKVKGEVRWIAIIDILMNYILSQTRSDGEGGGITSFLMNMFAEGLEQAWDLANHYLIPYVAIEGKSLKEGVKSMQQLKDEVPESLAGIFGIDILGYIGRVLTLPLHFIFIVIAFVIASLGADLMPDSTLITLPHNLAKQVSFLVGESGQISWLPIIVFLFFSMSLGSAIKRTITAIKISYFTIFYMKITHPDEITPELQDQLDDFLQLKESPGSEETED
ncbi:MAG: hypothetical protein ABEK50_02085 [bacterium]